MFAYESADVREWFRSSFDQNYVRVRSDGAEVLLLSGHPFDRNIAAIFPWPQADCQATFIAGHVTVACRKLMHKRSIARASPRRARRLRRGRLSWQRVSH